MIVSRKKPKYKSAGEKLLAVDLTERLSTKEIESFGYETEPMKYTQPAKERTYNPDFIIIRSNGTKLYVEVKGLFDYIEREKFLNILNSNPEKDIRILFSRDNKITKNSKTRYSDWCRAKGIKYAVKTLPEEWLS